MAHPLFAASRWATCGRRSLEACRTKQISDPTHPRPAPRLFVTSMNSTSQASVQSSATFPRGRLTSHATPDANKWLASSGFKSFSDFFGHLSKTPAGSISGGVLLAVASRINAWTEPDVDAQLGRLSRCIVKAGHLGQCQWPQRWPHPLDHPRGFAAGHRPTRLADGAWGPSHAVCVCLKSRGGRPTEGDDPHVECRLLLGFISTQKGGGMPEVMVGIPCPSQGSSRLCAAF